ncbi:MAG TPA: hypothetical protein VH300_16330 [Thermoleophilaceae bacterium]|nr:hypothetical protein [Thermoleophilaceae bacterium]
MSRAKVKLSQDAAIVLSLAGTAMPFAHSREDEAERWLRVLRMHGRVGEVLQALGVPEAPLMTHARPAPSLSTGQRVGDAVNEICRRAVRLANVRSADRVATLDILFAVLATYGPAFDRALYVRGTSRDELLERLASTPVRALR